MTGCKWSSIHLLHPGRGLHSVRLHKQINMLVMWTSCIAHTLVNKFFYAVTCRQTLLRFLKDQAIARRFLLNCVMPVPQSAHRNGVYMHSHEIQQIDIDHYHFQDSL